MGSKLQTGPKVEYRNSGLEAASIPPQNDHLSFINAVSIKATDMRIYSIEYLRGLAALSVAWFHLTNTYDPHWVRVSGSYGWLGVEVFFVISGFIIPYALSNEKIPYSILDFPRFLMRRLARLEPPYLASVALALILWNLSAIVPGFAGTAPSNDIGQIGAHLLYLVPLTNYEWLQPVYWTLAWEFAFYIIMGLLFPWFGANGTELRLVAVMVALMAFVQLQLISGLCLLFVMGIATFKIFTALSRREENMWRIVSLFGLMLGLATLVLGLTSVDIAFVGVATSLLIIALPAHKFGGSLGRILLGLGAISYSLYLTHVPIGGRVVNLGRRFVDQPWQ